MDANGLNVKFNSMPVSFALTSFNLKIEWKDKPGTTVVSTGTTTFMITYVACTLPVIDSAEQVFNSASLITGVGMTLDSQFTWTDALVTHKDNAIDCGPVTFDVKAANGDPLGSVWTVVLDNTVGS